MIPARNRFLMLAVFLASGMTEMSVSSVRAFTTTVPSSKTRVIPRRLSASITEPPSQKNQKKETGTSAEETTEKYGLEAGLFQSLKEEGGAESAKSLLKKYGIAYLATSVPLAAASFAACYALVQNGVDMSALLNGAGIESTGVSEAAGTAAVAYAAHKALSPVRFPPTVLLTPVVAKWIGKEPNRSGDASE